MTSGNGTKKHRSSSNSKKRPAGGSIDVLPSGALRVRVDGGIDPVTKKRHRPTETIPAGPNADKLANDALIRLLNQVNERRHPKTNATVSQLLERFIARRNVERTTLARDIELIDLHILPLIGNEKAGPIDGETLDSLYTELRRCRLHCKDKRFIDHRTTRPHTCDNRCRPHACLGLGPGTIRKIHFLLSAAYKKGILWGWWSVNPMDCIDPPPARPAKPNPPKTEEAATIINRAWRDDPAWGTQVWTSAITGSRRGEACAIRRRHHDYKNRTLHLKKAIAQLDSDAWEKPTKTEQERIIVLDKVTNELLEEHWQRCVSSAKSAGILLTDDAFYFSLKIDHAKPLKPRSVTQRYRRLCQKVGIKSQLKALRHYSATELIAAGVDVRTVAGRLGHSGGGTTTLKVYSAWLAEADQRAAESLLSRVPDRPVFVDPIESAKSNPEVPYEQIAAAIRRDILDGALEDGALAPTVKEIASRHAVSAGTAHRSLGLLRTWGLLTEAGRGRRPRIIRLLDELDEAPVEPPQDAKDPDKLEPDASGEELLAFRLLELGEEVKAFQALADPTNPTHLRRLLQASVRRHTGAAALLEDYELEVRRADSQDLITTFAAIQ
ncbi:tyrosine-type recombinase/integrase [Amycolatopsis japonica]|uniref:tyrosine-type recombinase/integrase n=1 Tax=Amycolatopsis japonica TaxID=208439 RepID=UPI00367107E9